jgi:hypothetical protein
MKIVNKYLLVIAAVIFTTLSCTDESKFPMPLSELQGSGSLAGAYLRVLEYESTPVVDLFDLENADQMVFRFRFEAVDSEGGNLADKVELFARFRDFTVPEDEDGNPIEEEDFTTEKVLVATVTRAVFSGQTEKGYPIGVIETNMADVIDALNLDLSNISGTDAFDFEWNLHLTDGRVVDRTNIGLDLPGPFYNSPFFRRFSVICVPTATVFTGTYLYEPVVSGPFGPIFGSPQNFEVSAPDYDDSPTTRSFTATYLANLGIGNAPRAFFFDVICESTVWRDVQGSGLQCSSGILLSTDLNFGTVDPLDDTIINLHILEFGSPGDCGVVNHPTKIRLTKVN